MFKIVKKKTLTNTYKSKNNVIIIIFIDGNEFKLSILYAYTIIYDHIFTIKFMNINLKTYNLR